MWLKALYLRLPDLNAIDLFFDEKTINKSNRINKKQIIDDRIIDVWEIDMRGKSQ